MRVFATSPLRLAAAAFACLLLLAPVAGAQGSDAEPRIVGGTLTPNEQAPWAVLVHWQAPNGESSRCSGSIVAADRVLTAAHCVYSGSQPRTPDGFSVASGWKDDDGDGRATYDQVVTVETIEAHPHYLEDETSDVAILHLARPFSLDGPRTQPIAVQAGARPGPGTVLRHAGFGATRPDGPSEGRLFSAETTALALHECGPWSAVTICVRSDRAQTCPGDSGGTLATVGPAPVLVGVHSRGEKPCRPGGYSEAVDLAAPEIARFLQGDASPPIAPRWNLGPSLRGVARPTETLTCHPGTWSGSPEFTVSFFDGVTGATIGAPGAATYPLTKADIGRRIGCEVTAANPGGTGVARSFGMLVGGMLVPDLVFAVREDGFFLITPFDLSTPLQVVYRDGLGRVARTLRFTEDEIPSRPSLAPGEYSACLESPETGYYAATSACITDAFDGQAARLVRRVDRSARRAVVLRVAEPAVGARATAFWAAGRSSRVVKRSVRLRAVTRLRVPRALHGRRATVVLDLPGLRRGRVAYAAGTRQWSVGRR